MIQFWIGRVQVRFDFSFFAVFSLLCLVDAGKYLTISLAVCMLHELGHLLAMRICRQAGYVLWSRHLHLFRLPTVCLLAGFVHFIGWPGHQSFDRRFVVCTDRPISWCIAEYWNGAFQFAAIPAAGRWLHFAHAAVLEKRLSIASRSNAAWHLHRLFRNWHCCWIAGRVF